MTVMITIEPPRQVEVMRLLALSDAYAASLYPAESNHMVDIATLEGAGVSFSWHAGTGRSSAAALWSRRATDQERSSGCSSMRRRAA